MFGYQSALEKVRQDLAADVPLHDVVSWLAGEGATIMESIKIIREGAGVSLGEAKQVVSCHEVWRRLVDGNQCLHEEAERALATDSDPLTE